MSSMAAHTLTREDLDALPEDGLRHELIDGQFVMTPSPGSAHQITVTSLTLLLGNALRDTRLQVLVAPFDVVLGPNVVEPDLLVTPQAALGESDLSTPPLLVVEILSPSTAHIDRGRKRNLYEEFGVHSYWIVDPAAPSVTIMELDNGRYEVVAHVVGDEPIDVTTPVALTFTPAELTRG